MFDIGWSELLVIGVVSLIVVGPKDLPGMFHSLGRITAKARSMAREFSRAMEDAAEGTGVKEAAQDFRDLTSKKSLGLDALEQAASSFEKWEPKLPSGLKAPNGGLPEAAGAPGRAPEIEVFDEAAADAADMAAQASAAKRAAKAAPKSAAKPAVKAAPKAAPKAMGQTAEAVSAQPAAVKPAAKAAVKTAEKPAAKTAEKTDEKTARAPRKAAEPAAKGAAKSVAKSAVKSPRKPKPTDKA